MTRYLSAIFLLIFICTHHISYGQSSSRPVYVIVHGAWGGGWAFKKVDSLMTERGCTLYRPTLTGQGERVHLASADIRLNDHIHDVVNMILYEDLHDIILVGHSYGGMVITGVADSLPERISKLIYLDAFIPENGESLLDLAGTRRDRFNKMTVDGLVIPTWVPAGKLPPKDVPHPLLTITDSISLHNPLRSKISSVYILTVAKGTDLSQDDFTAQAVRAKSHGWPVLHLEADHNPQWSAPEALVEMLLRLGK